MGQCMYFSSHKKRLDSIVIISSAAFASVSFSLIEIQSIQRSRILLSALIGGRVNIHIFMYCPTD